ncbi:MAG: hypothetical protein HN576_10040 [Bacteriovoracaceae bacterium]|jgi:hypothetical protein|nr:hypothetical protein [Bacteriovoracaceae bacterium]
MTVNMGKPFTKQRFLTKLEFMEENNKIELEENEFEEMLKLIQMESIRDAKLEGPALDAILSQIDRPTIVQ